MAKSRTRTRHLRVRAIWYFGQYQRVSAEIFPMAVSFWAAVATRAQVPGVRPAEKCPGIPEPSCCPRCSGEPGWRRCAGGHESRLRQSVRFKTGGAYAECCPERCGRRRERGSSKGRLPAFFRCCFRTWTASSSGGKVQDYRWPLPAGRRIRHFARCPAASADTAQALRDFTVSGWPESSYSRCQSAPSIPSGRPIRFSGPLLQNARGPGFAAFCRRSAPTILSRQNPHII